MNSLLDQIKKRRIALELKQHDMMMRVGISRQQYQRLESKGNPRLNTLELVALGLNSELLLIPRDKLNAVHALLADGTASPNDQTQSNTKEGVALADDPWQGLLGEND